MSCKVKHCRFPNSHVTSGHRCGTCHNYGHGQLECSSDMLKNNLTNMYASERLRISEACSVPNCRHSLYHKTNSHFCTVCRTYGHDCNAYIQRMCPQCKLQSDVDTSMEIFTDVECIICFESKKKVVFSSCKHANVCKDCCERLN